MLLSLLLLTPTVVARAADPVEFNRDVRPILSDKCFACHGPDAKHRKGDLRLDVEKEAKAVSIVPGKPAESPLVDRITAKDPADLMPPQRFGKMLTAAEIETLRRWIAEGAKWSAHWAYVPPVRRAPPATKHPAANFIDSFLFARLEHAGLSPSPEADRITLCRRLYFDLTGLPPTPDEVDAFVKDTSPDAYPKLVDRLLASEHYGERMAVYWLDLVRYADTVGYHGDQDHHASPYRDYVIDAFNLNLPFDRFTREQLAGDLLPNPTTDQKIATCYNRLLQTSHEGGVQPKEYLAIYAADRVRNLSAVWMGATVGCAQCHDHKFDPYTQRDFYALSAFFADVDEEKHLRGGGADTVPTKRPPEIPVLTRRERARIDELNARIAAARTPPPTLVKERDAIAKKPRLVMVTQAVTPRTVRVLPRGNWLDESGPVVEPAIPAFLGQLPGSRRATRLDLANWLTDAKSGAGGLTARVFVNRLWAQFFGAGLSRSPEDFGGQGEPPVHPELLDALAAEFVAPSWRAEGRPEPGAWDVKHMVRLIVTSRAYRQSSEVRNSEFETRNGDTAAASALGSLAFIPRSTLRVPHSDDPENRLFSRQGRWRLPAEAVRDNALAVSGLLIREVGGPSVKPYQPAGYYRHLNFPKRQYEADTTAKQWRRGVYVHWQRQFLHPMLKAFDAPSREECTARRPRSNTPLAALVLLNDPTFVEAARVLAQHTLADGGASDADRATFAFRQATGRRPDGVELKVLVRVLEASRARYRDDSQAATDLVHVGLAPLPKGVDVPELAAWTGVCRAVLNLNEVMTRE